MFAENGLFSFFLSFSLDFQKKSNEIAERKQKNIKIAQHIYKNDETTQVM